MLKYIEEPSRRARVDRYCRSTKPIEYIVDSNGCHICVSHKPSSTGYPRVRFNGVLQQLSHFIWEKYNGFPPGPGLFVCHTCDNRLCINPDHLFLGTAKDNNMDMKSKNRNYVFSEEDHKNARRNRVPGKFRGSQNGNHKLTESDVKLIRSLYPSKNFRQIAREFHVDPKLIAMIVRKEVWKYVD